MKLKKCYYLVEIKSRRRKRKNNWEILREVILPPTQVF